MSVVNSNAEAHARLRAQSATQTTVEASPSTTVVYGESVVLDITAVSLNAAYLNLTDAPYYDAYIFGGDLDMGVTVPLYSQYGS